jgi:hypothetical protein
MLGLCFLVFVSHGTKQNPKGWVSIQTGQVDPLNPFILNGFTGSCRVTREFSRVYPLDTFIKRVVSGSMLNGSQVNRVVNGSCRVTRFASLHLLQHLLYLFECLVQSFDDFQEHYLRLPYQFLHCV